VRLGHFFLSSPSRYGEKFPSGKSVTDSLPLPRHRPGDSRDKSSEFLGRQVSGGDIGGATPVPIPNTEVKPSRANGTARFPCGRVGRCRSFLLKARTSHDVRAFAFLRPPPDGLHGAPTGSFQPAAWTVNAAASHRHSRHRSRRSPPPLSSRPAFLDRRCDIADSSKSSDIQRCPRRGTAPLSDYGRALSRKK
jgi:hypothetical protein